jgi:AcrR family transcriptional regulator
MDNKKNILEKSLHLFSLRGYDAVGVQEICTECSITKPTLYHHFGSKMGLMEAIFELYYPPFIQKIKSAADYNHDLVVNLESLTRTFFMLQKEQPVFTRFSLAASFAPVESDIHATQKKYTSRITNFIEGLFLIAVTDHGNMRGKEHLLAMSFIGLLQSYCVFALNNEIELNDQVVFAVVKQFMHGIFS